MRAGSTPRQPVRGGLLVLVATVSVIGTVIVPRKAGGSLTRLVDRAVIDVPAEPDLASGISLTYDEYLEAIIRLREARALVRPAKTSDRAGPAVAPDAWRNGRGDGRTPLRVTGQVLAVTETERDDAG